MDLTAPADGSASSAVEEPQPDSEEADDASRHAPDTLHSRSRSRSSSSPANTSCSSISSESRLEARYRLFPPLLPSTNRPDRHHRFTAQLASLAHGTPAVDVPAAGSTSARSTLSSGEQEEYDGGEGEDNDDDVEDSNDGGPEGEEDEDTRVQALWARLRDQLDTVRQLRRQLSDKRKRLREFREKKVEADNRFMGMLRPYLVVGYGLGSPADAIMRQFEEMQRESNDYHEKEAEVEQLEAELDNEELSLEILQMQFFSILYGASGGSGHEDDSAARSVADSSGPPSRASLLGIPADRPVDTHPLYEQLLDAIGERGLVKEHYTDIVMYRDSILYELKLAIKRERLRDADGRPDKSGALPDSSDLELLAAITDNPARVDGLQAKYKAKIGKEKVDFLRDYPKEEAMVQRELEQTKDTVDRLRQLCTDKGVMRKNAPYDEEYCIFSGTGVPFSAEAIDISQEQLPKPEEALANTRFPILLSNPRHVLEDGFPLTPDGALRAAVRLPHDHPARPRLVQEAIKEYGISHLVVDSVPEDKSDYINRWLLHRLRTSPLEVELLYTIFSIKLKVRNMRRWQEDVLYHWMRDETNKAKEEYDAMAITRDTRSIDENTGSESAESALDIHGRPESDPEDSVESTRRHRRSRSSQSAS